MTVILEARHLTKSYGGVTVVDDLSVSLQEGEALGVVGPNGAGKTTMLNLLTGIVRAEKDAAWREMALQVAHEIKNPLTPMKLAAQQILKAWKDRHPDLEKILERGGETIVRQVENLGRIASDFGATAEALGS